MSGPSKVVVLDPDPRAGKQVQLGFEREGVPAWVTQLTDGRIDLGEDAALLVIGGRDGDSVETVRLARKQLDESHIDLPILFTGTGVARADIHKAGAHECLLRPAFLRDVVTIGRLMRAMPPGQRDHLMGTLAETGGVFTLVRAVSRLGRSGVLTLVRGLRRGEVRFFEGEVTSAQVGMIHGQAALHQLLLWTDARFEFEHEDIVKRGQIPLTAEELFADAERFLESVRESAGALSPAMVLDQDLARITALGAKVPTEVHGVLRMFDGHRVLADILEDSPYRVFETLRVAQKAVEAGLLKPVETATKTTWRTVLTIEEWLVGSETREEVAERTSKIEISAPPPAGKSKKKRRKKRAATPAPVGKAEIDWEALVPRVVGGEVGPLSTVVPASGAHGEIVVATRAAPREGLEALMDTGKREKIFPTEIGLEPSIVVHETAGALVKELVAPPPSPPPAPEPEPPSDAVPIATEMTPSGPDPVAEMIAAPVDASSPRAPAPTPPPKPAPAPAPEPAPPAPDPAVEAITAPVVKVADDEPVTTPVVKPEPSVLGAAPADTVPTQVEPVVAIIEPITAVEPVAAAADTVVPDLASAHAAASVAYARAPTSPLQDAATIARELAVHDTQADAANAFDDVEEAFFRKHDTQPPRTHSHSSTGAHETFADLDEGYEPPKFWDRVFGRKRRHGTEPPTPPKRKP
jgi:hypothetical protein